MDLQDLLLVETPRSWYQKHQAMKPIDKLKHEVKQPPQLQQKEKREAVCFFKPFRVANGMTSLPSMLAMLTELSQQLPAGRLTRESSGACCYGGAFRNLEASPVGRGCHLRLRKFVTCDPASPTSHICHLRFRKSITRDSSPFSVQTKTGVGWGGPCKSGAVNLSSSVFLSELHQTTAGSSWDRAAWEILGELLGQAKVFLWIAS